MTAAIVPSSKPVGGALVVGSDSCRQASLSVLRTRGYDCHERLDPYAAINEICRRPLVYRAIVFSLQSLYREELPVIATIRKRFPHIGVFLTHSDGRQAAMAEAMRFGAHGLLDQDGLHPFAIEEPPAPEPVKASANEPANFRPIRVEPVSVEPLLDTPQAPSPTASRDSHPSEPVLTAEELRALLGDDLLRG